MNTKLFALLAVALSAGCSATPRPIVLTPIPGVTSIDRFVAMIDCETGLRAAGLEIADAARGTSEDNKALKALKVMDIARSKGLAKATLLACERMIDNAERARVIRATAPK